MQEASLRDEYNKSSEKLEFQIEDRNLIGEGINLNITLIRVEFEDINHVR